MAEPATATVNNADAFTGTRFLLDAQGTRQYAVRYEKGDIKPPLQVFDTAEGGKGRFYPNEKIFAFDDDMDITMKGLDFIVHTVAYQITTDAQGKPRNIKQAGVDYVAAFDATGKTRDVTYTMTPESQARLKDRDYTFDPAFPTVIKGSLDGNGFDTRKSAGGLILPGKESLPTATPQVSFPPHHNDSTALLARTLVEKWDQLKPAAPANVPVPPPVTAAASRYSKADDQTLVEKKNIGDSQTLKIVFNFESRRVTEAVAGAGLASHKFEDYDQTALEVAFRQLKLLGGAPRPMEKKSVTAVLPKPAAGG